jgi:hypothetical protein
MILKIGRVLPFYLPLEFSSSHLFISPAMTTKSHFFSSAFIYKFSRSPSNLASWVFSFVNPDLRKVFVIWSNVVSLRLLSSFAFYISWEAMLYWSVQDCLDGVSF